jgi:hypothetical protein
MALRKNPNDYDYKPLRQGDLDGLCGVYAVLNALQWLVPEAQNSEFLTKVFDRMMGSIINIDHVRDGGEEPEIEVVHGFVAEAARKKFKVKLTSKGETPAFSAPLPPEDVSVAAASWDLADPLERSARDAG